MINLKKWPFKFKKLLYLRWLQKTITIPKIKLGSQYGAWSVPLGIIDGDSVCYLAGAGEDISFDVEMAQKFKCNIHLFDPTPRAIAHFNLLCEKIIQKEPFFTSTGYQYPSEIFNIKFHDFGLWDKPDTLKFYAPKNSNHVSYSALNLQGTNNYFEAKVDSLKNTMAHLNHTSITLLKLDIEGAEYKVIDSIINDNIAIDVLCIEFDESHTPLDGKFHKRITQAIESLKKAGYLIYDIDSEYNTSMIHQRALTKIKKQKP